MPEKPTVTMEDCGVCKGKGFREVSASDGTVSTKKCYFCEGNCKIPVFHYEKPEVEKQPDLSKIKEKPKTHLTAKLGDLSWLNK